MSVPLPCLAQVSKCVWHTVVLNQAIIGSDNVSSPGQRQGIIWCLSHIQPRTPYDFYHPYDFLPVRPSEAPVGFLRRCCSRSHIRLRAPYGLNRLSPNGLVEWFAGLHGCPVRCPYGPRKGIFNVFHILRDPCGTHKGAARHSCGHVRELIQPKLTKFPHGRRIWPYGPLTVPAQAVHGLFRISKPVRGP